MSTVSSTDETGPIRGGILAFYYLIRRSISLSFAGFGVLLLALGRYVIDPIHPTFAGMFGIWGATAILAGLVAYSVLWLNKIYGQLGEA